MISKPASVTINGTRPARPGVAVADSVGQRSLVLAHPPQHGLMEGFSSGLVALANHVSNVLPQVHVQLLDLGLTRPDELPHRIEECLAQSRRELFVGITTTTASYQAALKVAEVFKRLAPQTVVIMGGHHASAQDRVVLEHQPYVDMVVRGEGEIALVELLRNYPDLSAVPNLTFRSGFTIKRTESAPLLDQDALDRIGPTFRGWGVESAPGKFDHATYVSARGCPLKCAFCAVANERIRSKSVDAVIRDLHVLIDKFGYRSIAIEDNFFAQSPRRTKELCRAIEGLQREHPFRWDCQTRVESCKRPDVVEAMGKAGCEAVYLGVESFDPKQLRYLGKSKRPEQYIDLLLDVVVPMLLRSPMNCYVNLQLGLPCRSRDYHTLLKQFLTQLGTMAEVEGRTITIFPMLHVVYPGTAHFYNGLEQGLFSPEVFERFTAWEEQQQPILRWLGEHFAHGTGGIPIGILNSSDLRDDRFTIEPKSVLDVVNCLETMRKVPGIKVFQYGKHLARHRDECDFGTQSTHSQTKGSTQ